MDGFKIKISDLIFMLTLLSCMGYNSIASADSAYLGGLGSILRPSLPDGININNGAQAPHPYNKDHYSIHHDTAKSLAVQVGYEWQTNHPWFPSYSLGLQVAHYELETIKGSITQYSLPQFKNYRYSWNMASDSFSVNTKINVFQYGSLSPFVNAGIGLAINRSNNFYETAFMGVTPRISPEFGRNTQDNLTYSFGAGVDYFLSPQLSVLFAYNYQNLGPMRSSNGLQRWSEDYLYIKNYQINMLVFGVVYRFNSKHSK